MKFKRNRDMKKRKKAPHYFSRKFLLVYGLFLLAVLGQAGCVDINDSKVQVQPPDPVEEYADHSIVDQCTPHVYPHRLIVASTGVGSPLVQNGAQFVGDQSTFDQLWGTISPQLDQNQVVTSGSEPVVDWTQQTAFFVPKTSPQSCVHWRPFGDGMVTDCLNPRIYIYEWKEGECKDDATSYPVFVYIYPKSNLPVYINMVYPTPTFTFSPLPTETSTPTPMPISTPTPEDGDG
jgi:hypothetical protein